MTSFLKFCPNWTQKSDENWDDFQIQYSPFHQFTSFALQPRFPNISNLFSSLNHFKNVFASPITSKPWTSAYPTYSCICPPDQTLHQLLTLNPRPLLDPLQCSTFVSLQMQDNVQASRNRSKFWPFHLHWLDQLLKALFSNYAMALSPPSMHIHCLWALIYLMASIPVEEKCWPINLAAATLLAMQKHLHDPKIFLTCSLVTSHLFNFHFPSCSLYISAKKL